MARIAFYISGHGLGHAMRMKELLGRVRALDPRGALLVMGSMPGWVFTEPPALPAAFRRMRCDAGASQRNSLRLDVRRTLVENRAFYRGIGGLAREEAGRLRRARVGLVVGDIPPLAFLAASAAGIPSVAVGNFSWDWIYEAYEPAFPSFRPIVELIRDAYARADLLLRLPFHGRMDAFRRVRDIPLITRRAARPRRPPGYERYVPHAAERVHPAVERKPEEEIRPGVGVPDQFHDGPERRERRLVRLVDPIPREVPDRHARNARGGGGEEGEGRDVAHDEPYPRAAEPPRLLPREAADPAVEGAVLDECAPDVEAETVPLRRPGVAAHPAERRRQGGRLREDPPRHRAHDEQGAPRVQGAYASQELLHPHRVAEPVAAYVEGDARHLRRASRGS